MTARSGRAGTGSSRYRRNRAIVLAHSDLCWLCGHAGAATADHVIDDRSWPRDGSGRRLPGFDDVANLMPAHGTMGPYAPANRCPTCGRLCNQSRGARMPMTRPQSRNW